MPDRIVLITGSARGIGRAVAARFAQAGDTVIHGVRDPSQLGGLQRALEESRIEGGPDAEGDEAPSVVPLDVTNADVVDRVVSEIVDQHGHLDILVNNAGRSFVGTLEDLSDEDLRASLEVNFLGAARLTRAVLPHMRAAGGGRILALSSMGGAVGTPFNDAYSAAKFAIEGLYEALAPVVARFGIHLTLLEPGPVAGEFLTGASATTRIPSAAYTDLYESFVATREAAYATAPSPIDVAERLFDLSGQTDPPLRAQDTEATTRFVATKLQDTDGRRTLRTGSRMVRKTDASRPPAPSAGMGAAARR